MADWKNRIVGYGESAPDQLLANEKNWRIHPRPQQEALSGVLDEVGYVQAAIVNKRTGANWGESRGVETMVDGHLRCELAISKGQTSIPVVWVDLDPAEESAVLATLDPLSAMAVSDPAKLDELLRDVKTGSAALQEMLADLAKKAKLYGGEVTEDEAPEPPKVPVSKQGDLWLLGEHRLLCGDSTKAEEVGKLLVGRKPFLMVTDPPYGVEYDPSWRNEAAKAGHLAHALRRVGEVSNDDRASWADSYKAFPGDVAYIWHADRRASEVQSDAESAGFVIRNQVIWSKPHFPIGRGDYHWRHEPCWYAVRDGRKSKWCGDRTQTTIWNITLDKNVEGGHSTQKPVECMARPIRNHGDKDDDVYDPFLGSGTTIIAAQQLSRRCYGLEISPAYCDVIVERWEKLTGGKAKLEGTTNGKTRTKTDSNGAQGVSRKPRKATNKRTRAKASA